jgi:hypothetical protein
LASPTAESPEKKYRGLPLYVTWVEPSSGLLIVPIVPVAPLPAVGVVPVGTVSGGHFVMQPAVAVHALVPLFAVSSANWYSVMPFAPATMSVPWLPTVAVMMVPPPDAAGWLEPLHAAASPAKKRMAAAILARRYIDHLVWRCQRVVTRAAGRLGSGRLAVCFVHSRGSGFRGGECRMVLAVYPAGGAPKHAQARGRPGGRSTSAGWLQRRRLVGVAWRRLGFGRERIVQTASPAPMAIATPASANHGGDPLPDPPTGGAVEEDGTGLAGGIELDPALEAAEPEGVPEPGAPDEAVVGYDGPGPGATSAKSPKLVTTARNVAA